LVRQSGRQHVENNFFSSGLRPRTSSGFAAVGGPFAYRRIALACLFLLSGTTAAYAGEGDVFTPYVGYGVYHDDNISRQPDDGNRQGDTWYKTTAGLRIDKAYSLQRFTADLSVNDTKFDRFDQFDNDGRRLAANWAWAIGSHLTGNLGASETRDLTPFGQRDLSINDALGPFIRTQKRTYIDGGWRFHPAWRLRGSYNHYDVTYDGNEFANLKLDIGEVGIDYLTRAQNKIGFLIRHTDGKYPNSSGVFTGDYKQDEAKLNVSWKVTGKTDLEFLGGWARRKYDSDFETLRDFSGADGRLTANWKATGKTTLSLAVYRELGSGLGSFASDDFSNYSRNKGVSLSANWQATAKILVDASFQRETRDYNGIVVSTVNRSDTYRKNTIGVTFLPLRQLSIRASVYQQYLDSNVGTSYSTKGFMLTTRYEF
jgi:exopolysaccharide biosynthesis operon protein EpsL